MSSNMTAYAITGMSSNMTAYATTANQGQRHERHMQCYSLIKMFYISRWHFEYRGMLTHYSYSLIIMIYIQVLGSFWIQVCVNVCNFCTLTRVFMFLDMSFSLFDRPPTRTTSGTPAACRPSRCWSSWSASVCMYACVGEITLQCRPDAGCNWPVCVHTRVANVCLHILMCKQGKYMHSVWKISRLHE